MRREGSLLFLLLLSCAATSLAAAANNGSVSYDHRALVIDGKRRILISGSIHYPRSTPEMWPELIQKSKDGGIDVIETYVFWNIHEPTRNQTEMQRFTARVVDMMKQEKLYASQGGPIILSQIENEYGNVDSQYGSGAKPYINWSASMATSQDTGVPWVMCQQPDAPDPIINTCNGFYCDQFTPNSNSKPKMWTENWSGWFLSFGGAVPYRPVEDLAFAVARFFERGGTFQNYYMYQGGTNFGRTSGGPFISTSYDYDAPIDEYGMVRQPKWGHLKDLHKAIKLCEDALVATDPTYTSLGTNLESHVYKTGSASCAAFLANIGTSDASVTFNGKSYHLPAWSVSILPDCKTVVFNTAQINSQATRLEEKYRKNDETSDESSKRFQSSWSFVNEPVGISKNNAFTKSGLLEQINTTADASDYLWYSTSININGDEPFLLNGTQSNLHVESLGHILHAFINGKIAGSGVGSSSNPKISFEKPITLAPGSNKIDLLSATVGLQNYGAFYDLVGAGITGPVKLKGQNGSVDLSSQQWTYQVGLKGEESGLYGKSADSSEWTSDSTLPTNQPLIWYKTTFDAPDGNDPIAIDFTGMGKGEAWVNGQSIGRYWPTNISPQNGCATSCNYRGAYSSSKCFKNCGKPSQQLYHIPRSFIDSSSNTLVLFEEMGGDPAQISVATKQIGSLCAHVSELHPAPIDSWVSSGKLSRGKSGARVHLECPYPNQIITSVKFASFGTPHGSCGSFNHGKCSSDGVLSVVQEACIGSESCSVPVSTKMLGDPCRGVTKSLAVEAVCS
ncbi:beta-galactosidase 8 isoform X2 [Asparagus officinalis]|uniref:beta-galactosidase 8 isoform X2 n=1 Tax=Asparagus officinalis TaxID=4686 RepID=UPI00098E3880|nr:beta-galactosidase 8 isoform X2 [Asparagus officinalis]